MARENFTTMDINLGGFLELHGLQASLEAHGMRVIFSFPATATLYSLLDSYNRNCPVPILDYVTRVKALRARMLSRREEAMNE